MLISWLTLSAIGNQILLWIDSAVYGAVAIVYDLFLRISKVQLFTADTYGNFAQRIYAILGVVMLFVLAYNLLKAIVNPDDLTKGDKSFAKVAKNLIISLVIIGLLPTAFDYAYRMQNFILNKNIIGALFFGSEDVEVTVNECSIEGECKESVRTVTAAEWADAQTQSYGRVMAFTALNAFLNPDNINFQYNASEYTATKQATMGAVIGCGLGTGAAIVGSFFTGGLTLAGAAVVCAGAGAGGAVLNVVATDYDEYTWNQMVISVLQYGDFQQIISLATVLSEGGKSLGDGETIEMRYFPFVSTLCGVLLLYLLVSFCLDLGVRAVRLAFLQLIAPIPIFLRAMPGRKKAFDEWLKKTMTTYFEVFVRVFLMYFAVYFLSNLKINTASMEGIWVNVIVIMGVIAFVKEAPKLLGSVLGIDSGNMKIGIMPKLAAGGALAAGSLAIGAVGAGYQNAMKAYKNIRGSEPGLRNKVWAGAKSLPSLFAGTASGAIRGGIGGVKNKNFKDVVSNGAKGAKGAFDARTSRADYRANHGDTLGGVVKGHIKDAYKNLVDYGSGGFEADDSRLKHLKSELDIQNLMDTELTKVMDKNDTNLAMLERNVEFKGVTKESAAQFAADYLVFDKEHPEKMSSLATIRKSLKGMEDRGVAKENYLYNTVDENGHILQRLDETAYNQAIRDHDNYMGQANAMLKQLEKATKFRLNSATHDTKLMEEIGIKSEKYADIINYQTQHNDLRASKGESLLNLNTPYHVENGVAVGLGNVYDDQMTAVLNEKSALESEVNRKKREIEERKANSGKKS